MTKCLERQSGNGPERAHAQGHVPELVLQREVQVVERAR